MSFITINQNSRSVLFKALFYEQTVHLRTVKCYYANE